MKPHRRAALAERLAPGVPVLLRGAAAPQVHVHVRRIVLDGAAPPAADIGAALQQALEARLHGTLPPANHTTPLDQVAARIAPAVGAAFEPAARR